MREEIPSMFLALKVWWAFTWRVTLVGILIGVLLSFISEFIRTVTLGPNLITAFVFFLLAFIFVIGSQTWVFNRLMTKGFGKYRLVVVNK